MALPEKSTSQRAVTLSLPFTEALAISLIPLPPEPIAAKFNWSLGEINPGPPRTFLGTIKIPAPSAVDFFMKFLLVLFELIVNN